MLKCVVQKCCSSFLMVWPQHKSKNKPFKSFCLHTRNILVKPWNLLVLCITIIYTYSNNDVCHSALRHAYRSSISRTHNAAETTRAPCTAKHCCCCSRSQSDCNVCTKNNGPSETGLQKFRPQTGKNAAVHKVLVPLCGHHIGCVLYWLETVSAFSGKIIFFVVVLSTYMESVYNVTFYWQFVKFSVSVSKNGLFHRSTQTLAFNRQRPTLRLHRTKSCRQKMRTPIRNPLATTRKWRRNRRKKKWAFVIAR